MKEYKITDINHLLSDDFIVKADSMKQALETAGYNNIERDYTNKGNIIVTCNHRTYVFFANKEN